VNPSKSIATRSIVSTSIGKEPSTPAHRYLALAIASALSIGLYCPRAHAQSPSVLRLSQLNGNNGVSILGEAAGGQAGRSVSAAGDINGDGLDDLVIGAPFSDVAASNSGRSYVLFGSQKPLAHPFELATVNGLNGFVLRGIQSNDGSGFSVSEAGDINADGIDDLLIGAPQTNGQLIGEAYAFFGSNSGLPNPFDLINLNGLNGVVLTGEDATDYAGFTVSIAGDINGDGIDDVIIGAPSSSAGGGASGISYVVFGSSGAWTNPLALSGLDGSNGFALLGSTGDQSAYSVSAAGDVNGDGFDDLIIGSPYAAADESGGAYLVFGSGQPFPANVQLGGINGVNGLFLVGEDPLSLTGHSVSGAGDINSDGVDDLIIGAWKSNLNGFDSGRAYVVFGSNSSLPHPFQLSSLNGLNGFWIDGQGESERLGFSVSGIGDFNGDGVDDIAVGAPTFGGERPNPNSSGRSYVIFGSDQGLPNPFQLASLDGSNGFALQGFETNERSGFSVAGTGDVNGDGFDDLLIGAPYADDTVSGRVYLVYGGVSNIDVLFADRFAIGSPP